MPDTNNIDKSCCGPGYASPSDAIKAPSEKLLYTIAIIIGVFQDGSPFSLCLTNCIG